MRWAFAVYKHAADGRPRPASAHDRRPPASRARLVAALARCHCTCGRPSNTRRETGPPKSPLQQYQHPSALLVPFCCEYLHSPSRREILPCGGFSDISSLGAFDFNWQRRSLAFGTAPPLCSSPTSHPLLTPRDGCLPNSLLPEPPSNALFTASTAHIVAAHGPAPCSPYGHRSPRHSPHPPRARPHWRQQRVRSGL